MFSVDQEKSTTDGIQALFRFNGAVPDKQVPPLAS